MADPIPYVVSTSAAVASAPDGAIPINLYQAQPAAPEAPNAVVVALIAAGFGTAGQLLATNATADGFEWVDAPL